MTPSAIDLPTKSTIITWEKLPDDFILPDEPVDNNLQPLLAAALRESLELAGLILESMLIASNFGLCATVKLMLAIAPNESWGLRSLDISAAFLQGRQID